MKNICESADLHIMKQEVLRALDHSPDSWDLNDVSACGLRYII